MQPSIARRSLLAFGAAAGAGTLLLDRSPFMRSVSASASFAQRKLLFVFLRGGNDGVNTVIPSHDPDYSASIRPTAFIPPQVRLDLGNGAAAFHPALQKLKEVYDEGNLAVLHRIGYEGLTLSHFASQQFLETAKPGDEAYHEGFIARWVDRFAGEVPLGAVSVSERLQLMFQGERVLPHVPDLAQFRLGSDAATAKLLGSSTSGGLLRLFHAGSGSSAFDGLIRETGIAMSASLAELSAVDPHAAPSDLYPQTSEELAAAGLPQKTWTRVFLRNVRDAVAILEQTGCRAAGVELDGFDLHVHQGGASGPHAELLATLGHAMRSIWLDTLDSLWPDLAVIVLTEFGRTSRENGGQGTDHGKATAMFIAGGSVNGGVYNCDAITWPGGATLFSDNDKYVAHRTDFRALLAEVFDRHMGVPLAELDQVVPGWSDLSGSAYDYLGFLGGSAS